MIQKNSMSKSSIIKIYLINIDNKTSSEITTTGNVFNSHTAKIDNNFAIIEEILIRLGSSVTKLNTSKPICQS